MPENKHRVPIHRESGFHFPSIADAAEAFDAEKRQPQSATSFIYTRYGNPSVVSAEQKLAELQGANWSVLTSSGMAAIDVAVSVFQAGGHSGPWLFCTEIYGGTKVYLSEVLVRRRGVDIQPWEHSGECYTAEAFEEKIRDLNPGLIFFESISNPLLIVPEARRILEVARARGIPVIVDNTMASPWLWRPLEDGASLVVDSATKYFGGHGNLTGGVISGMDERLRDELRKYRKLVGCVLSPDDAYRLETQLITFPLRFPEQCGNARRLAEELAAHPGIVRVIYPGLESHPTFEQARELFGGRGYGAMITFELKGGREACDTFVGAVSGTIPYVATFGDARSILLHAGTVFDGYPEGMIRLSVGFEAYERLKANMLEGLSRIGHLTPDAAEN